jgi:predicted PurR-regulated permease PerM
MASTQTARVVLVVLVVIAFGLMALIAAPFKTALFLAAVLSGALLPWTDRLANLLRGRRSIASGILTLAVFIAVVLPLAILATAAVSQIVDGIQWIQQAVKSQGMPGLIERLPGPFSEIANRIVTALPQLLEQAKSLAASEGGRAAAVVGGVIGATVSALLQTAIMLAVLFFLLRDGRKLVGWLDRMIPLKDGQLAELLADFRNVTVSVLFTALAIAGVQAVLAFFGYLIAGVPYILFFTFATFVLALVPFLGASAGILCVALLQLATGHTSGGIFLLIWIAPVSVVDNFLKPFLMRWTGGLRIHIGVIFMSFLGGIAAFGPVGIVAGPLCVAFFIAVLRMYRRDFGDDLH